MYCIIVYFLNKSASDHFGRGAEFAVLLSITRSIRSLSVALIPNDNTLATSVVKSSYCWAAYALDNFYSAEKTLVNTNFVRV